MATYIVNELCFFHSSMLTSNPNPHFARESFTKNPEMFLTIYDSKEPYNTQLPKPWCETLNDLQKMIIYRGLRPDKVRKKSLFVKATVQLYTPVNECSCSTLLRHLSDCTSHQQLCD